MMDDQSALCLLDLAAYNIMTSDADSCKTKHISKTFEQKRNRLPAAVLAREGKRNPEGFFFIRCRARITGTPHGIKEFGVERESRTGGLQD
jgi:hypothetical protein